jgi:hypothetical protein
MKNEMCCNDLRMTTGNGTVAGFLSLPGRMSPPSMRRASASRELWLAREEGIRAFTGENVVWWWITAGAVAVLGMSLLG